MYFSKSKYTDFWKCPKLCWLQKHKPDEKVVDASASARMAAGQKVGNLAKLLFGDFVDATVQNADGTLDLSAMIERTQQFLALGKENICEAAFSFDGLYCAVDILHKEKGGYAIYEVKSTAEVKPYHIADVAYQKYVLEKCGINVTGAHVVVLNNKYVRKGELDINQFFLIDGGNDISAEIADEYDVVESNLKQAEGVMACSDEPDCELGCKYCGECEFWKYCSRILPKPSVFDLYGFGKKQACYSKGIVSFDDILKNDVKLTDIQQRQIDYALNDRGTYINKAEIAKFLGELTYPLYFLDFETMQLHIPEYDGARSFEQIPFQYSLHYIERENGEVMHKEFLAESSIDDPRRTLAEELCSDIAENACILAYHSSTESGIIGKLAELFPDLRKRLLNIKNSIKDLLPIFKKGYYYKREMGGSFSIKSVLPAVFPDKDYHNLDGVRNGTDAMDIFPRLKDMPPEQAQMAREQLLKYCERDTEAMVLLWQELVKVSK